MPMLRHALVALALGTLAGCAGRALPYEPATQPPGARLSAAYQVIGDRLRVEIDSGGRRVEEAVVLRDDGTVVWPLGLTTDPARSGPVDVGVGVGGGTWSGRVGVGTGVSVGFPVGGGGVGSTFAYFPRDAAGPSPWRVRIKLAGLGPVDVMVGTPR
jgi:hypothetical protein